MTATIHDRPADRVASILYVIGTYPLLTTTFVDREVRALRDGGLRVDVVSLRRPPRLLSPDQLDLASTTTYVRPARPVDVLRHHARFFARRPARYLTTLARLVAGRGQTLGDRVRTIGHFGLGVHVAGCVERVGPPHHIHAHFIDRAAVVAHVVSRLLDRPYSVTAHANDIYVAPVLLDAKIGGAEFVATCTGYNAAHLRRLAPHWAVKVVCVYHGIELDHYEPGPGSAVPEAGDDAPLLLSVGQLKPKKGFVHLLAASRLLADRGVPFRCEIIGEGPQRSELERRIHELGLAGAVTLRGALPHDEVVAAYRRAAAFVLACVEADDGDRDGIPNVILEAMAMALPVVSTVHSGIPEAVEPEVSGLLVPPGDHEALAEALELVLSDPDRGRQMGARGREVVAERFDLERNVALLRDHFAPVGVSR